MFTYAANVRRIGRMPLVSLDFNGPKKPSFWVFWKPVQLPSVSRMIRALRHAAPGHGDAEMGA